MSILLAHAPGRPGMSRIEDPLRVGGVPLYARDTTWNVIAGRPSHPGSPALRDFMRCKAAHFLDV
jgi:hypothetical protein